MDRSCAIFYFSGHLGYFSNRPQYLSGFHVFTTREDARSYKCNDTGIVRQVFVRKVRTAGIDCRLKVLVADEMFIPKNWKSRR